jgi:hypothetical protein
MFDGYSDEEVPAAHASALAMGTGLASQQMARHLVFPLHTLVGIFE